MRSRDDSPPSATPDPTAEPESHASRAFRELIDHIAGREGARLLDLGPAVGANVAFLSGLPAKLHIADLHQSLAPEVGRPASGRTFVRALARDLPAREQGAVRAILLWDLLNYLRPEEIRALGHALEPYCDDGTLVFALVWTTHEVPPRPLVFEIESSDALRYRLQPGIQRPSPGYKEADLTRWLRHFRVETSYLLRSGLQEFLFVFEPGGRGQEER